jgi:sirohydrochlorin ferrochelatase
MTPEMYEKIKNDPAHADKVKAFEKSQLERETSAKQAVAFPRSGNLPMTEADRDRMASKLERGGYTEDKVQIVKDMIAAFDAKG